MGLEGTEFNDCLGNCYQSSLCNDVMVKGRSPWTHPHWPSVTTQDIFTYHEKLKEGHGYEASLSCTPSAVSSRSKVIVSMSQRTAHALDSRSMGYHIPRSGLGTEVSCKVCMGAGQLQGWGVAAGYRGQLQE